MGLGTNDLVLDPKSKSFRLIHTSFRGAKSVDGRYHSFWVHRLFQWNGSSFQHDTELPTLWIQYLDRPNHTPTKLLTTALKQKAWLEDADWYQNEIEW
jgi:hypothetical protein